MKLLKAVLMTCFLVTCLVVKRTLSAEKTTLTIGLIAPYTSFKTRIRAYNRAVLSTVDTFSKSNSGFSFPVLFNFASPEMHLFRQTPNPRTILDAFCKSFLEKKVTVILYMMNSELYGTSTAASQYFLQLASYLGIPVIAWNADNSGLERKMMNSVMVQLAPTIHHQSAAMLRILQRYQWSHFSIVTSEISGNMDFIQAVRDNIYTMKNVFKFTLLSTVRLTSLNYELVKEQLSPLLESETRVILLYSTYDEAKVIFKAAKELELVGRNYMWVVTQSVVGNLQHLSFIDFPLGSLGVHFDTDIENMAVYISMALKVFAHGLDLFTSDISNFNASLQPDLSCSGRLDTRWAQGVNFYRYLKKVNISMGFGKPNIEFNKFGSLKNSELDVINLNDKFKWEKIGSWTNEKLEINDIVWPGNSHIPPAGRPEKFHLKVTFLEELPYVNLEDPDEITGTCVKRGELCRVATDSQLIGVNLTEAKRNASFYKCCSGLCVDLLQKFANDLGFTYDLVRVEDGIWGSVVNGTWNGLIAALINRKADIVMTSLKINSQRSEAIDFSIPFLETGIAVVVAKRTGIVSPMAFLEPFDTMSWLLILIVSIQMAGFAIFMFEWLSPVGYDMKFQPPRDHKFSLFRTYWLVWAMLFGAAVEVDCPRGFTARFMANVWAMFAVVFLAIYTANLAAFMITREEFYDLTGIGDNRLMNPFLENPPFRFGTVSYGNTEAVLKANYPQMYNYMRQFNRSHVSIGIQAVKKGELDAFIYDSTVLEYLVTQDDECRLLTVGTWYAMTGYGVAFPKRSKYLDAFNKQMMIYRENGDLERLQRFWLTGACRLEKQERSTSNPLGIKQFTSAFLLLGCGIVLALLLLATEHCYFSYLRKPLASTDTTGCCALVSLSMGKSLTFREAVFEAQDVIRNHKCADPLCDTHLWKVKHELDIARLRINALERALLLRHSDYDNSYSQPNRFFYKRDYFGTRDMTKNHVTSTEIHRCSKHPHGVSEIETVL